MSVEQGQDFWVLPLCVDAVGRAFLNGVWGLGWLCMPLVNLWVEVVLLFVPYPCWGLTRRRGRAQADGTSCV